MRLLIALLLVCFTDDMNVVVGLLILWKMLMD